MWSASPTSARKRVTSWKNQTSGRGRGRNNQRCGRLSVFTTDVRYHRDINEVRREVLGANFPTSTMVQVVALARPELLLEINATAVVA